MIETRQIFMRPKKSLGQSFLTNLAVAQAEAEHADGKRVLELGPGYGILTKELCARAKSVVAVEIDRSLYSLLKSEIACENLRLINKDFFAATPAELGLDKTDIMISNVPYMLSSKVIEFLAKHRLQAVLCLQKEFVEHMLAESGTGKYSRLSVTSQLCFSMTALMDVPSGNFVPAPKVDSKIIYLKPREVKLSKKESEAINLLMQHKKKTVRNAILDTHVKGARELAEKLGNKDERVFKLSPQQILDVARDLASYLKE